MLDLIRKNKKSLLGVVTIGFAGVLMISFGIDGYNGMQHRPGAVVTVDGKEIEQHVFYRKYGQLENAMQQQLGAQYAMLRPMLNLGQRAIDAVVTDALVEEFNDSLGLSASPNLIRQRIASLPFFQQSGLTDYTYRLFLEGQGLSATAFEETARKEVATAQLHTILRDLNLPTEPELRAAYVDENTSVQLNHLSFTADEFATKVDVADEAKLKQYFDGRAEQYRKPKSLKYTFVKIDPEQYLQKVEVTEQEIRDSYDSRRSEFTIPPEFKLRQIIFVKENEVEQKSALEQLIDGKSIAAQKDPKAINETKRAKAKAALEQLEKGEKFEDVARSTSEDKTTAAEGGDLGWVQIEKLDKETQKALDGLKKGQSSDIFETDKAIKMIQLEDKREERLRPFEEVRAEIELDIRRGAAPEYAKAGADELFRKWMDEPENRELSLVDFAQKSGLVAVKTENFYSSNEQPPGAPEGLTKRLITLEAKARELVGVGSEDFLVEVLETKEQYIPDFSELKEQVTAQYVAEQSKVLAKQAAENALKSIRGGEKKEGGEPGAVTKPTPIRDVAASLSKELKTTEAATRANPGSDPLIAIPEVRNLMFTLRDQKPLAEKVVSTGDTFYVIELAKRTPPDAKEVDEKKGTMLEKEREAASDRLAYFMTQSLRASADVWVDPSLLEELKQSQ